MVLIEVYGLSRVIKNFSFCFIFGNILVISSRTLSQSYILSEF